MNACPRSSIVSSQIAWNHSPSFHTMFSNACIFTEAKKSDVFNKVSIGDINFLQAYSIFSSLPPCQISKSPNNKCPSCSKISTSLCHDRNLLFISAFTLIPKLPLQQSRRNQYLSIVCARKKPSLTLLPREQFGKACSSIEARNIIFFASS